MMGIKRNIIITVLFVICISACQKEPLQQAALTTPTRIVNTYPSTVISPTASPVPITTPTISSAFLALLLTETPLVTPTPGTPFPVTGTPRPVENEPISKKDQESIKMVIQAYFDRRYYAFSLSNQAGIPDTFFDDLLASSPETSNSLELEVAKLRMDLKHCELNHLKFAAYEYFLDYENITYDLSSQQATVSLSKRENIIHEISAFLASGEPIMSRGYNEKHTIVLHREEGQWKIVSDTYRDYIWRMLRKSDPSADEILNTLDLMLANLEAAPLPGSFDCFRGDFSSLIHKPYPDSKGTPSEEEEGSSFLLPLKVKQIYLNGKSYEPGWLYSNPFINLYFQPDGNSPLRFIIELAEISFNQFISNNMYPELTGWKINMYPHIEDENEIIRPAYSIDLDQKIGCDSRPAFYADTSLEKIREELGNQRIYDYEVVNGQGEIKLTHSIYLNPAGAYLISDTFGDVTGLDGGLIGYPNSLGENKAVYPHQGRVIMVYEPQGGFYQLHYYAKPAIRWYPGLWTTETPSEIKIQIYLFREDGNYKPDQAFIIPDDRIIKGRKNHNFQVSFTFDELKDPLGQGNEFYVRFLDKDGIIIGDDYFYFVPYAPSIP